MRVQMTCYKQSTAFHITKGNQEIQLTMATYDYYYYYYFCPSAMLSTHNVLDFTDFGQRWSCETALSLEESA